MVNDMTFEAYLNELYMLIEANALPDGTSDGQFLKWNGSEWVLVFPSVGCTDAEACNYDSLATTHYAYLCQFLDACGVCNGPGDVYECGCEDLPEGDCDCNGNQVDALNVCGGECAADVDGDGICDYVDSCVGEVDECGICNGNNSCLDECGIPNGDGSLCIFESCGDQIIHDNYAYSTVQIGEQCWFAENCRYLPSVSSYQTGSLNEPVYYVYDYTGYDVNEAKLSDNYETYGVLYNWPAVISDGICPSGWHIPSDEEWMNLEISLGMSEDEVNNYGWRGTGQGYQMKSASGWTGSNSSGFNGVPGGYKSSNGFQNDGTSGVWWAPAESCTYSWTRELYYYFDNVLRDYYVQPSGYALSARCVIDNGSEEFDYGDCSICGNGILDDGEECDDGNNISGDGCYGCELEIVAEFVTCGDLIAHEGYNYSTSQIGEQCWFSENCRYLPEVSPTDEESTTEPLYYVYDYTGYDVNEAKLSDNYETYGVLYNWPAVISDGICPSGWHIPSDEEWMNLEISLGMSEDEVNNYGWRGTGQGYQMKSASGWTGSNSSGFNGVPGGYKSSNGFQNDGTSGVWWAPAESCTYSWTRELYYYFDNVLRDYYVQPSGYALSARCVIDNGSEEFDYGDCSICGNGILDDGEECDDGNNISGDGCYGCELEIVAEFVTCGDLIAHEGYNYSTVLIGDQCWFSENCRYLPEVSPSNEGNTTAPYYYVYNYQGADVLVAKSTSNYEIYGVLYNWPAVRTDEICPIGWHVPSDEEFTQLSDFLGGVSVAGGKMKEVSYANWHYPNTGATNLSGFTGLPGGYRHFSSGFYDYGVDGLWWSTSGLGSYSWNRKLTNSTTIFAETVKQSNLGLSARCIRCEADVDGDGICDNSDECIDNIACNFEAIPSEPCEYTSCAGCMDSSFCNYDSIATIDDGSCEGVGVVDECGVCNGLGPTVLAIDTIILLYDSIYYESISEWVVLETGADTTYTYECAFICGNEISGQIEHQGNFYSTVQIGDQCWFSENLNTSRYNNGDDIPNIQDGGEWSSLDQTETGAWAYFENDPDYSWEGPSYTKLYNWYAVNDTRLLCPSGWHVPSDSEWTFLIDLLEGQEVAGYSMKADYGWGDISEHQGSNSSGFSGLPGGFRSFMGGFNFDNIGYFWSSSSYSSGAWDRRLTEESFVGNEVSNLRNGMSVRCVKD